MHMLCSFSALLPLYIAQSPFDHFVKAIIANLLAGNLRIFAAEIANSNVSYNITRHTAISDNPLSAVVPTSCKALFTPFAPCFRLPFAAYSTHPRFKAFFVCVLVVAIFVLIYLLFVRFIVFFGTGFLFFFAIRASCLPSDCFGRFAIHTDAVAFVPNVIFVIHSSNPPSNDIFSMRLGSKPVTIHGSAASG